MFVSLQDWMSFWIQGHLYGPKEWGTPRLGKRDRKKGSEKLPKLPLP